MIILETAISTVRRCRDFSRIEARVTLWIKQAGRPVRPITISTNVPIHGAAPLRARLTSDAAHLARYFVTRPALGHRAA